VCVLFRFLELEPTKKASGIADPHEQKLEGLEVSSFVAPPGTQKFLELLVNTLGSELVHA